MYIQNISFSIVYKCNISYWEQQNVLRQALK